MGIYELLIFNQDIREALRANNLGKYQEYASKELNGKFLADQVLDKAIDGLTTLQEVRAIAGAEIT